LRFELRFQLVWCLYFDTKMCVFQERLCGTLEPRSLTAQQTSPWSSDDGSRKEDLRVKVSFVATFLKKNVVECHEVRRNVRKR